MVAWEYGNFRRDTDDDLFCIIVPMPLRVIHVGRSNCWKNSEMDCDQKRRWCLLSMVTLGDIQTMIHSALLFLFLKQLSLLADEIVGRIRKRDCDRKEDGGLGV
ncbi:hypothetical protein AVEN_132040-1 [Araneus ventricosus]|uniref:Uncharacterized protein n=1 Tax=Araneus ventricosus TaxID=182803 RepID=A0A4Y2FQ90_ARAVE|nr:hypothetical protein AVEN_47765-1 [Araneus ventricosus]GBM43359.1 hypothetical protein AVEN_132040-1 [Araneus ventricosus]